MNTANDWVEQLHDDLGDRSETIKDALSDVAEICGSPAGWWVDHRDDEHLLIYVLADGMLHRLRGERDPLVDDEPTTCQCKYEAAAIDRDWTYSLTVTRNTAPNSVVGITRTWTFGVGRFGHVEINHPSARRIAPGPDPTPFARKLAAAIATRAGGD